MSNSTRSIKPRKPRSDFPLFPHATGRWAKKVRGKFCYFGRVADDPRGEAALNLWLDQKDALLAGRTPRATNDALTVKDLCNSFLRAKEAQCIAGDIRRKTFSEYESTCKVLILAFGAGRPVDDLFAADFEELRVSLSGRLGVHGLSREVQQVRTIFKYAFEAGLIEKPMLFGPTFKKPPARSMRAARQKAGPKMFEPKQLRSLIYTADQPLKSMILLALNCGFGNNDCGTLPMSAVDLQRGWVSFPRPKTAIERRAPLWPETVEALKEAIEHRPKPKDAADNGLVFLTKYGQCWAKETSSNPVSQEFRKLLDELELHTPGKGFYTLRHVFQTIADEARDPVATMFIMGHSDSSMSGVYRERISDERLLAVVNYVHSWLFPRPVVLQ